MGIFDEAIKEHLELKRRHGAGDSELKQLEDEAFGPPERPEAVEEAPPRRAGPDIADLQEAPPPEPEGPQPEQEASQPEQEAPAGPSAEERQAIADQPTELYDVDGELAGSEPRAPSEEELVEEEIGEPRLAPVDPLGGTDEEGEDEGEPEEEEDFFDEQRLSDELDQALEAPGELEPEEEAEPEELKSDDFDPEEGFEAEDDFEPEEEDFEPEEEPVSRKPDEDLLEETPDFLEEAPEDDRLWFEQKPPKDFDFDD